MELLAASRRTRDRRFEPRRVERVCAWCPRSRAAGREDAEHRTSHGICAPCLSGLMAALPAADPFARFRWEGSDAA